MGWFESQIEERRQSDEQQLQDSLLEIADAITGRNHDGGTDAAAYAKSALSAVLRYYGATAPASRKADTVSADASDIEKYLEETLRTTGIMCRPVRLPEGWEKDAIGAMLGFTEDGTPCALIPRTRGGYSCHDPKSGTDARVGSSAAPKLSEKAYCFYRPLPARAITIPDLLVHMVRSLDVSDYIALVGASLVATLLGTVSTSVTRIIFGPVIESGNSSLVLPVISLMIGVSVCSMLVSLASGFMTSCVNTKLNVPLQAAIMMRLLSLPASFFADHQTGELSQRVSAVTSLAQTLQSMALSTLLSSLFSFAYIFQIGNITPTLVVPALCFVLVSCTVTIVTGLAQRRITKRMLEISNKLSNLQFSLIRGIQKIKLAGAESRAFSNWASSYAENARLTYNGPALVRLSGTIQTAISLAGTLIFYGFAIGGGVSVADYVAFSASFGMVSGAFTSLSSAVLQIAQLGPYLELAEPILKTVPESSAGKTAVGRLSGGFELSHVTFAYREGQQNVLEDIDLKVRPGSYVAIVGKTGCGKSTLLRLLLGFETPQRGGIYYDGHDLSTLDVQGVRRNIGVVLQDGKLFQGSIYENIAISAPGLSMEDAWHAAELAGIADDIRAMPMGMQTLISEGAGGVSGGQRQRLMIARAVAGSPKIIMFDEATSALDNVTQRIVSDSLDELKCTRLVIAHRLSTIRHCDRIVLLDHGRIAEDGTYEELIEKNGMFAELVARQQV